MRLYGTIDPLSSRNYSWDRLRSLKSDEQRSSAVTTGLCLLLPRRMHCFVPAFYLPSGKLGGLRGRPGAGSAVVPAPGPRPGGGRRLPAVGGDCSWKTAAPVSDRIWGWGGRCVWEKPRDGSSLLLTTLSPSGLRLHWRKITARENH